MAEQKHGVTAATRISDGTHVYMKVVDEENGKIARTLSPAGLETASCSNNHCVPILEVLSIPDWKGKVILVMPQLQEFDEPLFSTVEEALKCVRQLIEVRFDICSRFGLQLIQVHDRACNTCIGCALLMGMVNALRDGIFR